MPPSFMLALLSFAATQRDAFADLHAALESAPTDGGSQGGEQPPSEPVLPPVLPTLRAGDTSEEYAERFPAGLTCTIPAGLKYDPWKEVEVNGVYQLGGWIPADAPFTPSRT